MNGVIWLFDKIFIFICYASSFEVNWVIIFIFRVIATIWFIFFFYCIMVTLTLIARRFFFIFIFLNLINLYLIHELLFYFSELYNTSLFKIFELINWTYQTINKVIFRSCRLNRRIQILILLHLIFFIRWNISELSFITESVFNLLFRSIFDAFSSLIGI